MKRIAQAIGSAGLLVVASGCGDDFGPAASLTIGPHPDTLAALGATVSLTAVAMDGKGRVVRDRVRWSSTAPGVMSVDSTGLVTAVGLGAGTIRAQVGVATATTLITVAQRPARITITELPDTLRSLGETVRLAATVTDAGGHPIEDPNIQWESAAPTIASIDVDGTVTALANGQAAIRASSPPAGAGAIVTVRQRAVGGSLEPADTTVTAIADTVSYRLDARDARGNAVSTSAVVFSSDSMGIATTTPTGSAIAGQAGETRIRATMDGLVLSARLVVRQVVGGLAFSKHPPPALLTDESFDVIVRVLDRRGFPAAGSHRVTAQLVVSAGDSAVLRGPNEAVSAGGLAQISGLSIDRAGRGFSLRATSGSAAPATSAAADVAIRFTSLVGHGTFCGTDTRGVLWCWGRNEGGQLGAPDTLLSPQPRRAIAAQPYRTAFFAGFANGCGRTVGGAAICWGYPYGFPGQSITGPEPFGSLAGGPTFNFCGLGGAGRAYCVGPNNFGQLGNGTTNSSFSWTDPTAVGGNHAFRQIAPGTDHMCALTVAGATYCWGRGDEGQIGNGSVVSQNLPTRINPDPGLAVIASGYEFTCGLNPAGTGYCWGRDRGGEGSLTSPISNLTSPAALAGGHRFTQLSVGSQSACALTAVGEGYCWGTNLSGELGAGTTVQTWSNTPLKVLLPGPATRIAAGTLSACALLTTGRVYCWGYHFADDGTFRSIGSGPNSVPRPLAAFTQ
ncbi:MAG: Ig-like domain-containing protein [Gemmatimonadales bacterium]